MVFDTRFFSRVNELIRKGCYQNRYDLYFFTFFAFRCPNRYSDNENLFSDIELVNKTSVRIFIWPTENFLKFDEKNLSKFSHKDSLINYLTIEKPLINSLTKNFQKLQKKFCMKFFSIYTKVLETSFGHALSTSKAILAIWRT